ncbi:MAG: hypothetical protein FJX74_11720 [Armatimonadetes bacterium]|nr:hypothetical protein [Armatimonadota bacterium]
MRSPSVVLLVVALLLGGVGIALHAADETSSETPTAPKAATPRDVLDPLVAKCEWQSEWVEDVQAFRFVFQGPDVYVRLAGDYVVVQSYLGRAPRNVAANDLIRVLRKNYDLYQGKFGLDKDLDLWFSLATATRILDGEELNRQVAFVAAAAAGASELIKTETPSAPNRSPGG